MQIDCEPKDALKLFANCFLKAKETEEAAKKLRISYEEEIVALIETKEQGSKTVTLGDSGIKITVKRGLIYKANLKDIRGVFTDEMISIKELSVPIVTKIEEKLDEKGYEWYRANHPEIFRELSEFVTVTPKKTSVTVKVP